MVFKNVTVAGSGVLGYQIAFQTAYAGFKVCVYDINDEALDKAKAKFEGLSKKYMEGVAATKEQMEATKRNLSYNSNLAEAVKDADLLIEVVPENVEIKIDFYQKVAKLAPEKTIFASNSSTLLPSQFAEATGRPEQFIALHFANNIYINNTAEIMGHGGTSPEVFDKVVTFAKQMGMVALPIHKEQAGYILNSLLVPLLGAATNLLVNEVAEVETIDKTWMVATGAPLGPFGILDVVGLNTAYNINKIAAEKSKDPLRIKAVEFLKENYLDKNKLGVSTGEGFYTYPNPAYLDEDFLKP